MTDDVLAVKYSPDARFLAVALLDSTVKIFFSDTLKFFLSLYGHKVHTRSTSTPASSDTTSGAAADSIATRIIARYLFGFENDSNIICRQERKDLGNGFR